MFMIRLCHCEGWWSSSPFAFLRDISRPAEAILLLWGELLTGGFDMPFAATVQGYSTTEFLIFRISPP